MICLNYLGLRYTRLVICFSEDMIAGELKYTMLVIGLIESKKYVRLVICVSEDRNTGEIKYIRLVRGLMCTTVR